MKRINNLAIRDVLKRRKSKTIGLSVQQNQTYQPSLINTGSPHTSKQLTHENILQKLLNINIKSNFICQLNQDQKYALVQYISQKQSISYNKSTLAALMTVWRCPGTTFVDSSTGNCNQTSHSIQKNLSVKNFFVLHGSVQVFDKIQEQKPNLRQQDIQEDQLVFETESKPNKLESALEGKTARFKIEEGSGWGSLFTKRQSNQTKNFIFKINNAILIQIKPPEFQGMLVNLGGMDQQKKQKIIQQFPIFSSISKKILTILPYIQLRKYAKNQLIYKLKQQPQAIYLIIKGQIIFQVRIQIPIQKLKSINKKNLPHQFVMQTECLGIGNYFGQQQIIFPSGRNVNAICASAECDLLQIPIQKFDKLLGYQDFYEQLKASTIIKTSKRKEKIQKALEIYLKFNKNTTQNVQSPQFQQKDSVQASKLKISNIRRKSAQPVKIMHGNPIRKISVSNNSQPVKFSMLGANPDMYESTLKKFRKYTMKPAQKQKIEVNWNLKRVWKVLNLQSILRQDAEVASPEGRKFYQSHRRLQNHVQQIKSLRPKTSSSTYRTKLQYIAYLQQFNN